MNCLLRSWKFDKVNSCNKIPVIFVWHHCYWYTPACIDTSDSGRIQWSYSGIANRKLLLFNFLTNTELLKHLILHNFKEAQQINPSDLSKILRYVLFSYKLLSSTKKNPYISTLKFSYFPLFYVDRAVDRALLHYRLKIATTIN